MSLFDRRRSPGSEVIRTAVVALAWLTASVVVLGDVHTWKGGRGLWTDETQWTNGVPVADGDVVIARGTATLDTASAELASFTMRGGQLVFTGLSACVSAVEIAITNGIVTHTANSATDTNINGTWDIDGRVYFVCSNITLKAPGRIDAGARGYQGRSNAKGYGPGGGNAGANGGGGGGHGGAGGRGYSGSGGPVNGVATNPGPGSAGGGGSASYPGTGGHGGGLIRIEATGLAIIDGTITATGTVFAVSGGRSGGGSGGGIFIRCRALAGTNGHIQADCGNGQSNAGSGGGGRIAVSVDPAAQAAQGKHRIRITSKRGTISFNSSNYGDIGTLAFPDTSLLDEDYLPHTGQLVIPGFTNWTVNTLSVTNGWVRFPSPSNSFTLIVSNDLSIFGSEGRLQLFKPELHIGGRLWMTNSASLMIQAGFTNTAGGGPDYGALVSVSNDIILGTNCWIYPISVTTNGGSALFRMANLEVGAKGGFNADAVGFLRGSRVSEVNYPAYGPGKGTAGSTDASGAGYGGRGGRSASQAARGIVYGDALQPVQPGSGGAAKYNTTTTCTGGNGGGLIRIEASGAVNLDGTLSANGEDSASYGGGGSGGGIFVKCGQFSGAATGRLFAKGGEAYNVAADGGGGGGRIAVWYGPWDQGTVTPARLVDRGTTAPETFAGTNSILPGAGYTSASSAEEGTMKYVEVLRLAAPGCVMFIR